MIEPSPGASFHLESERKRRCRERDPESIRRGKLVERNATLERSSAFHSAHDLLDSAPWSCPYRTVSPVPGLSSASLSGGEAKTGKGAVPLEYFPSAGQCMLINLPDQFKSQDGVCRLHPSPFLSVLHFLALSSSPSLRFPGSIASNDLLTHSRRQTSPVLRISLENRSTIPSLFLASRPEEFQRVDTSNNFLQEGLLTFEISRLASIPRAEANI